MPLGGVVVTGVVVVEVKAAVVMVEVGVDAKSKLYYGQRKV